MKRCERRQHQNAREMERRKREKQGLRGYYISVNGMGIPSGFGVGAWRQELNKLCTALDPSILDIRHQPEEAMSTLRRRLKDNFEYSALVDRVYIRQLAGKSVTQRRAKLLLSLKCGGKCPAGFDKDIWRRLDRISKDPHREELSQRMKYANACKIIKDERVLKEKKESERICTKDWGESLIQMNWNMNSEGIRVTIII